VNKRRRSQEHAALLERVAEAYVRCAESWTPTADVAIETGLDERRADQLIREARMQGLLARHRGRLGDATSDE
jgi:hypothetical protein